MRAEFPLFLLSTFLQTLRSSSQYTGRCEIYSSSGFHERSINLACNGAVDYSYHVPYGYLPSDLNDIATTRLSQSSLSILPELCRAAYKKAICSTIYLPCLLGSSTETLSDNITGVVSITPYTIRFRRPCVSLCFLAHKECGALISLVDHQLLCDAQFDYSYGFFPKGNSSWSLPHLFDQTNRSPTCNSMTAAFSVGSRSEPYQYQSNGFCRGLVTEVFIPPLWETFWPSTGALRGLYFSPMQPPYVIQETIEAGLQQHVQQRLPVSLSEKCHSALKNYFCKKYFAYPQELIMKSSVITDTEGLLPRALTASKDSSALSGISLSLKVYQPYPVSTEVFRDFELNCGDFSRYLNFSIMAPQQDNTEISSELSDLQFLSGSVRSLLDKGDITVERSVSVINYQEASQASGNQTW